MRKTGRIGRIGRMKKIHPSGCKLMKLLNNWKKTDGWTDDLLYSLY